MSRDFYESDEWLRVRYRVLQASRGACSCCGQRGTEANPLQVDHIKPRSKFPHLELEISNLQVLCRDCNMGKSNRDATDWRFEPSRELTILNSIDPAKRFRLQQLGWLTLNGSKELRKEAQREYRKLWREIETEWLKGAE